MVQCVPHLVHVFCHLCTRWRVDEDDVVDPAAVGSVKGIVGVKTWGWLYFCVVVVEVLFVGTVLRVLGGITSVVGEVSGIPVP